MFQNSFRFSRLVFVWAAFGLMSCTGSSVLQEYFVEHATDPNFIALDLPLQGIKSHNLSQNKRSKNTSDSSLKSANVLLFKPNSDNLQAFDLELKNVQTILKHKDFQELITLKSNGLHGVVKFIEKDGAITEVILFGQGKTSGFILLRIVGNSINPANLMSLIQEFQSGTSNTELLQGFGDLL
jgi:hypothetical protein